MIEIDRAEVERIEREEEGYAKVAAAEIIKALDVELGTWEAVAWYLAGALAAIKRDRETLERVATQGMHGSPAVRKTPRSDRSGQTDEGDGI